MDIEGVPGEKISIAVYSPGPIKADGANVSGSNQAGIINLALTIPASGKTKISVGKGE